MKPLYRAIPPAEVIVLVDAAGRRRYVLGHDIAMGLLVASVVVVALVLALVH